MAIPHPKILSVVTVPTGGWTLNYAVSNGASLNTTGSISIPAGDYFIAWDSQSDDLLHTISDLLVTDIEALLTITSGAVAVGIDSDHKVYFDFAGAYFQDAGGDEHHVRLTWSTSSAALAAALGFDVTDDTSTSGDNPTLTADWHHGFGWYADSDGQLVNIEVEDHNTITAGQGLSISGKTVVQLMGNRYVNSIGLQWLTRKQTFSRGLGYGETNLAPYERNQGLECWWQKARYGERFRVYREGRIGTGVWIDSGTATASTASEVTDSAKSLTTSPQEHKGLLLQSTVSSADATEFDTRFYISSHTATVFTAANANPCNESYAGSSAAYYVLDQSYQTYVLDASQMREFAPRERPRVDYYDIKIPLLRYT